MVPKGIQSQKLPGTKLKIKIILSNKCYANTDIYLELKGKELIPFGY
jgi:hypothetical protein